MDRFDLMGRPLNHPLDFNWDLRKRYGKLHSRRHNRAFPYHAVHFQKRCLAQQKERRQPNT